MVFSECPSDCHGHGTCDHHDRCTCYISDEDGESAWTGNACSFRTCPRDIAWVGHVVKANDVHPIMECSHRGSFALRNY